MINPQISDFKKPDRHPYDITGKSETEAALAYMLNNDLKRGSWGSSTLHPSLSEPLHRQGFICRAEDDKWSLTEKQSSGFMSIILQPV